MQDSFDVTTLIFLGLAVFVIWRLRSVLGQKTGHERPPLDPVSRREPPAGRPASKATTWCACPAPRRPHRTLTAEAPVDRWKGIAEPGSRVALGLDEIARMEPFDAGVFVDGAKAAYEMIVTAFAQGDRKTSRTSLAGGLRGLRARHRGARARGPAGRDHLRVHRQGRRHRRGGARHQTAR
jgi:predicted lipid-binding transport protein (Tim44 family)